MREKLSNEIYDILLEGKSVVIVGCQNSGKTRYVKGALAPFLISKGFLVKYFENCDSVKEIEDGIIAIVDEVETLIDKDYLENKYKNEDYYSLEYLKQVKIWHEKLKKLTQPAVFVVTRSNNEDSECLVNTLSKTEWGSPTSALYFSENVALSDEL